MKASELITLLKNSIIEYGDRDVLCTAEIPVNTGDNIHTDSTCLMNIKYLSSTFANDDLENPIELILKLN